jgi:hypothetical protein
MKASLVAYDCGKSHKKSEIKVVNMGTLEAAQKGQ